MSDPQQLFNRYINNQCSPEEVEALMMYFHTDQQEDLNVLVLQELERPDIDSNGRSYETLLNDVYHDIQAKIHKDDKVTKPLWYRIAAAASILLVLSAAAFFYRFNKDNQLTNRHNITAKIVPGGNNAILTLASGKKIILNNAADGVLAKQAGMTIKKTAAGKIIYTVTGDDNDANTPVAYNTIETPIGGQYQVVLADGSLVWLNAGTKLRFPTKFTGSERKVELSGEGYFEVAHNKAMPFKVASRMQEITVLGTHFDVSNYADEQDVKTVLLQGSVRITSLTGESSSILLKPGQLATLVANNFTVGKTDTTAAVAWKNGLFRFDDEELGSIMRKVSRWYNVTVVYDNDKLKSETFNGVIQRFSNVSDLVKMLEAVGKVNFKIEGNRIRVMKKTN